MNILPKYLIMFILPGPSGVFSSTLWFRDFNRSKNRFKKWAPDNSWWWRTVILRKLCWSGPFSQKQAGCGVCHQNEASKVKGTTGISISEISALGLWSNYKIHYICQNTVWSNDLAWKNIQYVDSRARKYTVLAQQAGLLMRYLWVSGPIRKRAKIYS